MESVVKVSEEIREIKCKFVLGEIVQKSLDWIRVNVYGSRKNSLIHRDTEISRTVTCRGTVTGRLGSE